MESNSYNIYFSTVVVELEFEIKTRPKQSERFANISVGNNFLVYLWFLKYLWVYLLL